MPCHRRLTFAVTLLLLVPCFVAADEITGKYDVQGVYASGKKYSGIKVVVTKRGPSYEVV